MHAVVQLRGTVNVPGDVRETLELLHLGRVNHCTFVPDTPSYRGMLTKVVDLAAIGEPSADTVATVLRNRAEPVGGEPGIDDAWVAEATPHDDVASLATALCDDEATLEDVGLEPVVRLHPPRGGHRGLKQHRADGGQLGQHATDEIDELLQQMR